MKDLKISKKLGTTFGIVIAVVILISSVSIFGLINSLNKYKNFYEGPFQTTNYAMDMRRNIQSYAKNIGYAMMIEDKEKTESYLNDANANLEDLKEGTAFMKEKFKGDKNLIESFDNLMLSIVDDRTRIMNLALENKNSEASELYFAKIHPKLIESQDYLMQINEAALESAAKDERSVTSISIAIIITVIVLVGVVLIGTIMLALYITRSLTRPIIEIEEAADKMAKGDFDVAVTYESKDELGSLSNSINRMVKITKEIINDTSRGLKEIADGNLNITSEAEYIGVYAEIETAIVQIISNLSDTLKSISDVADQVSIGSEQMAGNAQGLAEGATEQAGAIEELTATITDVAVQVTNNANESQQAFEKAKEVEKNAEISSNEMEQMTEAMHKISETSNQIGAIIAEIEEIASQTNLLSLNAAIEAARAGEAGKGFAVVADQIRKLAEDSAASAVKTRQLIENSITQVEVGNRLSKETAKALEDVIKGLQEISVSVDMTNTASGQQEEAIKQIQAGIEQISGVVQNNSASAEETSASSEELSAQAVNVTELIKQFKLLNK